jgi:hypothetical protein
MVKVLVAAAMIDECDWQRQCQKQTNNGALMLVARAIKVTIFAIGTIMAML